MNTILIVEDNLDMSEELQETLEDEGFKTYCAYTVQEGIDMLQKEDISLCLLDIRLPDGNGYDLCQRAREFFQGPIVMLTACDRPQDIVFGFGVGADDYIVKPFATEVLLTRIKKQFENIEKLAKYRNLQENKQFRTGDLVIDCDNYQVWRAEKEISLGKREFRLIEKLIANYHRVVTRDQMIEFLWENNPEPVNDNTLTTHVSRVRGKLGDYHGESYIETVRGVGMRWNVNVRPLNVI